MSNRSLVVGALLIVSCNEQTVPSSAPDDYPTLSRSALVAARSEEPARVERALGEMRARMQIPAGLDLRLDRTFTHATGATEVRFAEHVQGVPLRGRFLRAVTFSDGQTFLTGKPDDLGQVDVRPQVSEAAAIAAAREALERKGETFRSAKATLMFDPEIRYDEIRKPDRPTEMLGRRSRVERFTLRWIVEARIIDKEDGSDAPWNLTVDARSGEVRDEGLARAAAVSPAMLNGYYRRATLTTYMPGTMFGLIDAWSNTYSHCSLTEPHCDEPDSFIGFDNVWGNSQRMIFGAVEQTTAETQGADAFISAHVALDMFSTMFGHEGWDGQGGTFRVVTNFPARNAYWQPDQRLQLGYTNIRFDLPPGTPLQPYGSTNVLGHEIGHGVFHARSGFWGVQPGELGGISEATADIFGALAEFYEGAAFGGTPGFPTTGSSTTANWLHADKDKAGGSGIRSMIDPIHGEWTPDIHLLEQHLSLGPIVRMFYFLTVGLLRFPLIGFGLHPLIPIRSSPYVLNGFTGIGLAKASRIWFHAIAALPSGATFFDARDAALVAAMYLDPDHRMHTPEYKAVEDAFAAIHVGDPADRQVPVISFSSQQFGVSKAMLRATATDANRIEHLTMALMDLPPFRCELTGCELQVDPRDYRGRFDVTITARDTRANEVQRVFSVEFDNHVPAVTELSDVSGPGTPVRRFRVRATDASPIDHIEVRSAFGNASYVGPGTPNADVTLNLDLSAAPNGPLTITAVVRDRYNHSSTRTLAIAVDKVRPSRCEFPSYSISHDRKIRSSAYAADSGSGLVKFSVAVDGAIAFARDLDPPRSEITSHSWWTEPQPLGQREVLLTCTDDWGNTATHQRTITVSTPPTVTLTASSPSAGRVVASATFTDADGIGWGSLALTCGDRSYSLASENPPGTPTSFTMTSDETFDESGSCVVKAYAYDRHVMYSPIAERSINLGPTCNGSISDSGGDEPETHDINVGRTSGKFKFHRRTFNIPDAFRLSCTDGGTIEGHSSHSIACYATGGNTLTSEYDFACNSRRIRVQVIPNCSGTVDTQWDFRVECATP
jgi:Zn-dependent metalloprotease